MSESAAGHLAALGLQRNPFPPTPDAQSYFYTSKLEREFSEALHCVLAHKGIVLLAGEVGLGKSTFVRHMLDTLTEKNVVYALVLNTFLQGAALLQEINRDFGIEATGDLSDDLAQLNEFLLQQRRDGLTCLVVIDDAQNLTLESLELVRLLTNLETGQEKLLQIVLAGQPELLALLAKAEIRQLTSRIVAHVSLQSLSKADLLRYFEFRISQAGAAGRLRLSGRALTHLHQISGGNPRRVHLILDRCLYGLVALRTNEISHLLVKTAAAEVDFNRCRTEASGRRWWPYALAAASLMLSGILGVSFAMQTAPKQEESRVTLAAPPPVPVTPVIQTDPVKHVAETGLSGCALRIEEALNGSLPTGSPLRISSEIKVFRLPDELSRFVQADERACLYHEGASVWVAWHPTLSSAGMTTRGPNKVVQVMQMRLAALGLFDVSDADGWFGPKTRGALARFQTQTTYGKDGEPDDLTLFLLEKMNVNDLNAERAGDSRG
ncbi:AAA family ATPase [Uliginosibacterium sp. 31-16]|uniref:ExeA family protein n=1 Tax=Uliginosibacterium sp. 31-16 TaxID=3068315 RepID=UPI00273F1618|nr:ExeA family protein [Uliginosibacterium sp. 31-16]MDP5238569.1 AAA family ATPase [Uliginosibacterium sp. 31-16]